MHTAIVDEWDVPGDDAAVAAAIEALHGDPPAGRAPVRVGLRGPSGGIYRVILLASVRDQLALERCLQRHQYVEDQEFAVAGYDLV